MHYSTFAILSATQRIMSHMPLNQVALIEKQLHYLRKRIAIVFRIGILLCCALAVIGSVPLSREIIAEHNLTPLLDYGFVSGLLLLISPALAMHRLRIQRSRCRKLLNMPAYAPQAKKHIQKNSENAQITQHAS